MGTKSSSTALDYLDEQIEKLQTHTAAALDGFDPNGIHQARVATRRLKAGLDLLQPLLVEGETDDLIAGARKLRRRLGRLRDMDVMIDQLNNYNAPQHLSQAVTWVSEQFSRQREIARLTDQKKGKKCAKMLAPFDVWWALRRKLDSSHDAISLLLAQNLHEAFDQFASDADQVTGINPSESVIPIDRHELRIKGKSLRYTFEIADAHGLAVQKSTLKSFKSMQESLGEWHDCVILADETVRCWADVELALHDPETAAKVLELARRFLSDSIKALKRFEGKWRRSGHSIHKALQKRIPLTRDVCNRVALGTQDLDEPQITESQMDPDPTPPTASEPDQIFPPTDPANDPE